MNRLAAFVVFTVMAFAPARAANALQGPSNDVPELQVLNRWVGKWDVDTNVKPNAGLPKGMASKGVATAEWVLDGKFVNQTWTLEPGDGTSAMKGATLMGYDQRKKVYRSWMFFSTGAVSEFEGQWDEKSRTMTSTSRDVQSGGTSTLKATFSADGTESWSIVEKARDGKVIIEMTGKNMRRKK